MAGELKADLTRAVDWAISDQPVDYRAAVEFMQARALAIAEGLEGELVWLLEHPSIYTAGPSAKPTDLIATNRFPVYATGRGGQYTYHGPGQRVIYVMLDVSRRTVSAKGGGDVRGFVRELEYWMIDALEAFNVKGEVRPDRVGVWVRRPQLGPDREDKIGAIGIRLKRWVSLHGMSLNVEPDLDHFAGIVPCGIQDYGVTSLVELGLPIAMADVDLALRVAFEARFGPTTRVAAPCGS